jgi:hypothetical protein
MPHRAALLIIGALAMADVAGAAWLWALWQARHGAPSMAEPGLQPSSSAAMPHGRAAPTASAQGRPAS